MRVRNGIPIKPNKTILLDFANSKDPDQAWESFYRNIGEALRLKKPPKRRLQEEFEKLKNLFEELNNAVTLRNSSLIHDYLAQYYTIRPPLQVLKDGTIGEASLFADKDRRFSFDEILAYCVVTFFRKESNVRLIHKCENEPCGLFFVAKKAKPKGKPRGIRFHHKSCRFDFHNQQKVEVGVIKEIKRILKKIEDPKIQKEISTSYSGYTNPGGNRREISSKKKAPIKQYILDYFRKHPEELVPVGLQGFLYGRKKEPADE